MASSEPMLNTPLTLPKRQRVLVLVFAFLGWMFAGAQMANFLLATSSIVRDMLGGGTMTIEQINEQVGKWFGLYISAFLLGAATGGLIFGWLGDIIGRAKTMGLSILFYSLVTGCGYFATSLEQLLVLRFIACMGIGGMWPSGVALASEAWSNASRPMLAGLIGTSANVGFVLVGVIGRINPVTPDHWRWLMALSAAPAILGVLVLLFAPESPRFLLNRSQESGTVPITTVFRKPFLKLTLIGICLGTIPLLGGWGTNNWLIKWADQVGTKMGNPELKATTIYIGSTGAAIGSLLGGWLASRFGRRTTYFAVSLGSLLLSGIIFWMISPDQGAVFLVFLFFLRLVSTVYFGWLPLYLPELFPTRVRSTGVGVAFNFGRILTAVGVMGTTVLVSVFDRNYAHVGRITHLVFALGMIVILFAPDTSKKALDD